jgi:hypothetical protein
VKALPLAVLLAFAGALPIAAQDNAPAAEADAGAQAGSKAEDLAVLQTVDGVYAAISGPVDQARDWTALRSLVTEDARFTPIGAQGHRPLTIDEYIERSGPSLVERGFFEVETGRRLERFGRIAHVWSAYEGSEGSREGPIIVRGINSFQLVRQDGRWKVFSILWQPAQADLPVPADLAEISNQEPE